MAKKQSALDKLLGRNKQELAAVPEEIQLKPKQEEAKVEEFMEVGGSPVPGITLRQVLRGHTAAINRIAWSPDGQYLASPSFDKTIRIWDVVYGNCVAVLKGHTDRISCVSWTADGEKLASGDYSSSIFVWSKRDWKNIGNLNGNCGQIHSIAWSYNGDVLVTGSEDGIVQLWNPNEMKLTRVLEKQSDQIRFVNWSPNGQLLIAGDIIRWDGENSLLEELQVSMTPQEKL